MTPTLIKRVFIFRSFVVSVLNLNEKRLMFRMTKILKEQTIRYDEDCF